MNPRFSSLLFVLLIASSFAIYVPCASAQVADYMHQMGEQYARGAPYWQKAGCTLPVWHSGQPMRVFLVPENARQYGVEEGDYLISINGTRIPEDNNAVTELFSAIDEDATVAITVYRAGNFEKFAMQCQSAKAIADGLQNLTESLLKADPEGCLSVLDDFETLTSGTLSAGLTETRHQCQMISAPDEFQENRAGYLFVSAEKILQESKFFPSQFEYSKDEVSRRIETIEALGESELAETLRVMLNDAIEFAKADYPAPTVY